MKKIWTIRVIQFHDARGNLPGLWIEQMRRLGMLRVVGQSDTREVIEIFCPEGRTVNTQIWAETNAERMRSFGINAVAAPKWDGAAINLD